MSAEELQKIIKTVVASIVAAASALYLVYNLTAMFLRFEMQFNDRLDKLEESDERQDAQLLQLNEQKKLDHAHKLLIQKKLSRRDFYEDSGE